MVKFRKLFRVRSSCQKFVKICSERCVRKFFGLPDIIFKSGKAFCKKFFQKVEKEERFTKNSFTRLNIRKIGKGKRAVGGRQLRSGAAGVGGTFTLRDHVQPLSQISTPSPSPQPTSANPRPRRRQKALQKILNRDFKALRIFCKPLRALQKILTI